jgi:hypothetical protein
MSPPVSFRRGMLYVAVALVALLLHGLIIDTPAMEQSSGSTVGLKRPSPVISTNSNSNTHKQRQEALLSLHICRNSTLTFASQKLSIPYKCEGQEYEEFGQKLFLFADNTTGHGSKWGRRPYPIPSGKTVLMFGNSHTRQVAHAMVCQYGAQVESYQPCHCDCGEAFTVRFRNDAVLHVVTNCYIVYTNHWVSLLERALHQSLDSMDAMVLGKFNGWTSSQNTNFRRAMMNITTADNGTVDFEHIKPPNLDQVAAVYSGPIVTLTMFAQYAERDAAARLETVERSTVAGRTNLAYIYGRTYVERLGECAADGKTKVTVQCLDAPSHRCTGAYGGHADLVAWDVIEEIFGSWMETATIDNDGLV